MTLMLKFIKQQIWNSYDYVVKKLNGQLHELEGTIYVRYEE